MGRNIPILNKDSDEVKQWIRTKIDDPYTQKRLVLVIVCVALLLDNMLYMVIVPIIPQYLRDIGVYDTKTLGAMIDRPDGTKVFNRSAGIVVYKGEDQKLGYLFASKAMVQIFVNPVSGTIIDRIGYEMPMIFGLIVMFSSTAIFALGASYGLLFFARSLQGLGSAFADTAGLSMIANRFTNENERSKALGIALAFISFGSLVAPPFGGTLYQFAGKSLPFMILSSVCLMDGFMVFMVIQPKAQKTEIGERVKGTPIWRLFMDPYIAVCSGALIMANVSLAFLEPTISTWMEDTMHATEWQTGFIWLPAFFPHVFGVYLTVVLLKKYPNHAWALSAVGLAMEGVCSFMVPFCTNFFLLCIPLSGICFGIALIDTSLLPMLGHLVDTRHESVYGSVYAIADISYSLAYAVGPIIAGEVVHYMGFFKLNLLICITNLCYIPAFWLLKKATAYQPFENEMQEYGELTGGHDKLSPNGDTGFTGDGPGVRSYGATIDGYNNDYQGFDSPGINYHPDYPQPQQPTEKGNNHFDPFASQNSQNYADVHGDPW